MIIAAAIALVIIGTGTIFYFAVFNKPMRTVTVALIGNGRVTLGTAGAYATSLQVIDGDSLTLTASPDPGWKFTLWSGDASGNKTPLTITVAKDMYIVATFTK